MFESLSDRISQSLRNLVGRGQFSDQNMQDTLKDVKKALLDADVALPVIKMFTTKIRDEVRGQEIVRHFSPGQALIKIVNEALVELLGETQAPLDLKQAAPIVVLVAGLQGSGKTTSVAKLAKWLVEREKKKVLVTSCDVYRPAARTQLQTLADEIGVVYHDVESTDPLEIALASQKKAKTELFDVLIVDTAGRLHIDREMMAEIQHLHSRLTPHETLFVVDGMTGQDAANTAKAFHEALPLTGIVVTKLDGDTRGGAVLSIRHITGKPIKFIGIGEKTDALEPFYPDRIASRILGMGDVLTLVEELERKIDKKEAEKLAKKISKGKGFDLEDFRKQLIQMNNMGGMANILEKLPGMSGVKEALSEARADKTFAQMLAIINSMTKKERLQPDLIKGSRKRRIAAGSGTDVQDINRLLKQFDQMQRMMKRVGQKGGMRDMMRQMQHLQQGMPAGMLPPPGLMKK